jgi:hypothetical protein
MTPTEVTEPMNESSIHGNLRDLHENAKAYSEASTALRETFGYSHSTTLAWLIRNRKIGPLHPDYHPAPDLMTDRHVNRLARWLYLSQDTNWNHKVVTWRKLTTEREFRADADEWRDKARQILRVVLKTTEEGKR